MWLWILCVILVVVYLTTAVEGYTSTSNSVVRKMLPRLGENVRINDVSLANGRMTRSSPGFAKKWLQGKPVAVTLQAVPKHTLSNNTELIGPSWVSVTGHGKTVAQAEADAKVQARALVDDAMQQYRARRLA